MSILDRKAKIKVEMTGTDGIRRKAWVDHDAKLYNGKYIIDAGAIFLSTETGFLGFGAKSVPTIAFRSNSIYPIQHRGKETIPDPDEFGQNVAKAAHAIAVLRETGEQDFQNLVKILLCVAILVAGIGAYIGYSDGTKITAVQAKLDTIEQNIQPATTQEPGVTTSVTNGTTVFDPATGTYHTSGT
jgi:hypothetical protein